MACSLDHWMMLKLSGAGGDPTLLQMQVKPQLKLLLSSAVQLQRAKGSQMASGHSSVEKQ